MIRALSDTAAYILVDTTQIREGDRGRSNLAPTLFHFAAPEFLAPVSRLDSLCSLDTI